jgi:hypothetical protein
MIVVKETGDGKWGLYLDGVLLGESKHRFDADHAKQVLLHYLQKNRSHSLLADIGRLAALSVAIAVAAWLVGYTYLVKIAGYPSTGFFTPKMVLGLLAVSFALCAMFMLRGIFRRPPA